MEANADNSTVTPADQYAGLKDHVSEVSGYIEALDHASPAVRRSAAEALGQIGDSAAVPALIRTLDDSIYEVSWTAAIALGNIGDISAIPALIRLLQNHSDANMRQAAAVALGDIGDIAAVPALIQAIYDPDSWVQEGASIVLRDLGGPTLLPRTIIASAQFQVVDRIAILKALGRVNVQNGDALKFAVLPITRYCENLLKRDDIEADVKAGAREILAQEVLLRSGAQDSAMESVELLRGASAAENASSPAELVRASDATPVAAPGHAARKSRIRKLLDRLFP